MNLVARDESLECWTGSLRLGTYVFLGFFDVDDNAEPPPFADRGDPVTLPSGALEHPFNVKEDEHTKHTVVFDFVMP